MEKRRIMKLHWKLFFPLVGLLWLIIGITITYSVFHETRRQQENLENRLLNVNVTVIDAYERGVDLQKTVSFIRLFTDQTTLAPLRLTVYDDNGNIIAANGEATAAAGGKIMSPDIIALEDEAPDVESMMMEDGRCMVSSMTSADGKIHSFAALPYEGEVRAFLSIDPMVWLAVIILGIVSSAVAFIGLRAVCRNVYTLKDFARAISSDNLPDINSWHFSKDELGDVSKNLLTVYLDKIHAEQEKVQHERQISQNVNHELKTPVGIIKGYLDTILSDNEMPEQLKHKFLVRAQQNVNRLAGLVNDVSEMTRLEDCGAAIESTVVNFHDLIAQIVDDINVSQIAGDMKMTYSVPADCYVKGHESLLTNALLNLADNAAKHSDGSLIAINWIKEEDNKHYFTFTDNGNGVDNEHLSRLFDLFYRVDAGRSRKKGGSGLGLPIVRKTFVALGGDITVKNAEKGGLEYTFSLPAASPEETDSPRTAR